MRTTSGKNYMANRVIVLTDKPQKPFPTAVFINPEDKHQAAADRAALIVAMDQRRAEAGAESINVDTGEMTFAPKKELATA